MEIGLLNAPHIHIMVNHFPVILVPVGIALMTVGLFRGSEDLKKAAAWIFVFTGLFAGAAFVTGDMASDVIGSLVPGSVGPALARHDQAAGIALSGEVMLAVFSLWGLYFSRLKMMPVRIAVIALAGGFVVTGLMGWTANLGGQIRHTEITAAVSPVPSLPLPR